MYISGEQGEMGITRINPVQLVSQRPVPAELVSQGAWASAVVKCAFLLFVVVAMVRIPGSRL